MKISEVTIEELKGYCRVDDTAEDEVFTAILQAAKAFIIGQTGLTEDELDQYEDLTMALFILGSDFYDTRAYNLTTTKITVNPAAAAIINQHCRNIL